MKVYLPGLAAIAIAFVAQKSVEHHQDKLTGVYVDSYHRNKNEEQFIVFHEGKRTHIAVRMIARLQLATLANVSPTTTVS